MVEILRVYCVLHFHVKLLCIPAQDNSWTNRKYQFTVHNVNKTWDEARVICMSSGLGVSLLTVHDESAWGMWVHLL